MATTNKECTFEGCTNKQATRGYCGTHYSQLQRGKELTPIRPKSPKGQRKTDFGNCVEEDCKRKAGPAKGLCQTHYRISISKPCLAGNCETKTAEGKKGYCMKHYKQYVLGKAPHGSKRVCSFHGCDKDHYAKNYCLTHYRKLEAPKNQKPCSVEGCTYPHVARGYCIKHYSKAKNAGEFAEIRFRAKSGRTDEDFKKHISDNVIVDEQSGCWIWQGALRSNNSPDPYGQMAYKGRPIQVHRVSYDLHVGPLEGGMVIDHICHTALCVNPDHLRQVTQEENGKNRKETILDNGCVYFLEDSNRWSAFHHNTVELRFLGIFATESEARQAQLDYNKPQAA